MWLSREEAMANQSYHKGLTRRQALSRRLVMIFFGVGLICLPGISACNMRENAKYKPYETGTFFANNQLARPVNPDTVARGQVRSAYFNEGMTDTGPAEEFPAPVTRDVIERGQERYEIYCAPCHGLLGYGDGMIVQRGFTAPPSFHQERLRAAPPGHFVNVIANGYGQMYSYATRVSPSDRWAITAYIQALQRSQNATLDDVSTAERQQLEENRP